MYVCIYAFKLNFKSWLMILWSQGFVRKIQKLKQTSCIETTYLIILNYCYCCQYNTKLFIWLALIFNVEWMCPMTRTTGICWTVNLDFFPVLSLSIETRSDFSMYNFLCSARIFPNVLQQTAKLLDLPECVSLG